MDENTGVMRNARFWTWVNGSLVKLTLAPGDSHTWSTGGPTEEGWRHEMTTWTHNEGGIHRDCYSEEQDCDGRYDRAFQDFCPMEKLFSRVAEIGGLVRFLPDWEDLDCWQRDYQAEAAGY